MRELSSRIGTIQGDHGGQIPRLVGITQVPQTCLAATTSLPCLQAHIVITILKSTKPSFKRTGTACIIPQP